MVAGRPPPDRQGDHPVPLRVVAGDVHGGRHRPAGPRAGPRLAAASAGEKMSNSSVNQIAPAELTAEYGVDPLRYHLLRDIPLGQRRRLLRRGDRRPLQRGPGQQPRQPAVAGGDGRRLQVRRGRPGPDPTSRAGRGGRRRARRGRRRRGTRASPTLALEATWRLIRETNAELETAEPWKAEPGPGGRRRARQRPRGAADRGDPRRPGHAGDRRRRSGGGSGWTARRPTSACRRRRVGWLPRPAGRWRRARRSSPAARTEPGAMAHDAVIEWFDSHCHLQEEFDRRPATTDPAEPHADRLAGTIARAAEAGVTRMVCVGTGAATSAEAVALARSMRRPGSVGRRRRGRAVGHDRAPPPRRGRRRRLARRAARPRAAVADRAAERPVVVAIGECGLDYHYDHSPAAGPAGGLRRARSSWPSATVWRSSSTPGRRGTTPWTSWRPPVCPSGPSCTASPAVRTRPAAASTSAPPLLQRCRHLQERRGGARGGRALPDGPAAGRDRLALPGPGAPPGHLQRAGEDTAGRSRDRPGQGCADRRLWLRRPPPTPWRCSLSDHRGRRPRALLSSIPGFVPVCLAEGPGLASGRGRLVRSFFDAMSEVSRPSRDRLSSRTRIRPSGGHSPRRRRGVGTSPCGRRRRVPRGEWSPEDQTSKGRPARCGARPLRSGAVHTVALDPERSGGLGLAGSAHLGQAGALPSRELCPGRGPAPPCRELPSLRSSDRGDGGL